MQVARPRESISEYVSNAKSDSIEVQQKALHTLVSLTKVGPQNRKILAQIDGAISLFFTLVKSSSPIIETLALDILFNLSLNPDLKQSLADIDTIRVLNSIIISPRSSQSSRLASFLVCSLAMEDKNKAKFGVAGTIQVLVNTISRPYYTPTSHHILSSLAELVNFHGNCTLAVRSGAIQVLIRVVKSPINGDDLSSTALTILGLLARFEEGLKSLIKAEQIVKCMVHVLKGKSMINKEGAVEILVRLFDESEECVRDAFRLPEFPTLLTDLSVSGSLRAREKASQLIKKMMEASLDLDP